MQIAGSVIAVTGGASGLGHATARRLVEAGAKVALVDLPGSDGESTAKELGANAMFAPGDVADEAGFAAALDAAESMGRSADSFTVRAVVVVFGSSTRRATQDRSRTLSS